jgi:hypothetical protein
LSASRSAALSRLPFIAPANACAPLESRPPVGAIEHRRAVGRRQLLGELRSPQLLGGLAPRSRIVAARDVANPTVVHRQDSDER